MKTLYIFNPEHEIALAANLAHFTAPHAGRQLRADLGWLPALWADADDYILVDHAESARKAYERLRRRLGRPVAAFVDRGTIGHLDIQQVKPWGWDAAMATDLRRWGVADDLLPKVEQLEHWRQLAHRRVSALLLSSLRMEGTVGEAVECSTPEEVEHCMLRWQCVVVKAPWSSSGRGVRFYDTERLTDNGVLKIDKWISNVIKQQGSVMVEPFYDKVKDFGMEFSAGEDGSIRYLGLSLFHTANGAYTGNILATENKKREMISRYISIELLDSVKENICSSLPTILKGGYTGPFGVDMMVVKGKRFLLHPCVEINLRRTMGHVALALTPTDDEMVRVMRIEFADGRYKMKVERV